MVVAQRTVGCVGTRRRSGSGRARSTVARAPAPAAVLALALTFALALAGCGGSGDLTKPTAATAPDQASSADVRVVSPVYDLPARQPAARRDPTAAVPILMYHVIGDVRPGTPLPGLWVSAKELAAHVRALDRAGYAAVTMRQVWDAWRNGGLLPPKPIVLSFDDGYTGHVRDALPTLRAVGWPGVLNLTLANLPDMGGAKGVRRLVEAGWEIGAHTLTHPDLTTLSDAELRRQLRAPREIIERLLGVSADFLCYPAGRYDERVVRAAREAGYVAATTVEPGLARPGDPYRLARLRVDGGVGATALLRRLRALSG